jgi:hypothetical protein
MGTAGVRAIRDWRPEMSWQRTNGTMGLSAGGRGIARLSEPTLVRSSAQVVQLSWEASRNAYAASGWRVTESLREAAPSLWIIDRVWQNVGVAAQDVELLTEVAPLYAPKHAIIPAVSYNGNGWGGGNEPKGHDLDGVPWTFASDRCAIPSATLSAGDAGALALFVDESPSARDTACAFVPEGDSVRHRIVWPGVERPKVYVSRDTYAATQERWIEIGPGDEFRTRAYVAAADDFADLLDVVWGFFRRELPAVYTQKQVWELGIRFVNESLWVEDHEFTGFSIGLMRRGDEWVRRPTYRYEIGWAGQNAALGAALIAHGREHGDNESLRRGFAALDFWAGHTRFPSGLFCVIYDQILDGQNEEAVADVCNLGYGAWQMMEAAALAEEIGRPRPEWMHMGLDLCDFFVEHQLPDGRFGRAWNLKGEIVSSGGTIGCFLLLPLVAAYRLTRNRRYLETAQRALEAYVEDVKAWAVTAGALDTDCIDKETAWPMLWAGIELYLLTGDDEALKVAEATAYYLSTWIYHHDVEWPRRSPLAELGYRTFGGTAVSVQHHHIDPWGAMLAPDLLRLAEATGKQRWREMAIGTWRQSLQGVSDGSLVVDGIQVPAGGQFEGYMQTHWGGPDPQVGKGTVSIWLVAWPTAFRLLSLMRTRDSSVLKRSYREE